MNYYKKDYLKTIEILIALENEGLIREEWEVQNFTKTIVLQLTNEYKDSFEIPVESFKSIENIKEIISNDYSEYRI